MNYNTGINWDLFFTQVDLIHDDKPVYIKNFLPNPKNFITWEDVSIILNNSSLKWRIIKKGLETQVPVYTSFTGDILQNKEFIQEHINSGSTFIIEKFITYNEFVKSLLNEIENYFSVAAGAHIFGSKNNSKTISYSPHVDNDPLFIFNIEGITKWSLFSNMSSSLLTRNEINWNIESNKLTPHSDYTLSPGDFLYIPKRFYHTASPFTQDPYRLSLNVSTFLDQVSSRIDKTYYQI
jgi:ribosomal protein L16 Arg81 hydroxylase